MAPLSIARGIQNKVLEALAMEKPVLASPEVCRTFGSRLPRGVYACNNADDYAQTVQTGGIRRGAMERFTWAANLTRLTRAVDELTRARR